MSYLASRIKFLSILEENARKPQAQVVNSEAIASMLGLSINETRQLIRCLNDMEVIQSDLEADRSLITQKGISMLERHYSSL